MIKKYLSMGVLFFLAASSLTFGQYTVNLLDYYEQGDAPSDFWELRITDWSAVTPFDTGSRFQLHVPPCPKAEAIVFEIYAWALFSESTGLVAGTPVNIICSHKIRAISPLIPPGVDVYFQLTMPGARSFEDGIQPVLPHSRSLRAQKFLLKPTAPSIIWVVEYQGTENRLPDSEARPILQNLVTKGFDVEFSYFGTAQGISGVMFGYESVYISSIEVKNK